MLIMIAGYNSVMGEILRKYPVTNDSQWKYDILFGCDRAYKVRI
jgi:hypothetical protein